MKLIEIIDQFGPGDSLIVRILFLVSIAAFTHLFVILVRNLAQRSSRVLQHPKLRSVISLFMSAIIFSLYFLAVGLVLRELGVSLTAYLASASVIGLAVGFGSQGIVQDVVMGLTIIFTDMLDVGDLVDVGGQVGRVTRITMRFVVLENALGAVVFIPNRSINTVLNYRRGYVRCLVDVTLLGNDGTKNAMVRSATDKMSSFFEQFPGICITEPSTEGRMETATGKEYLRLKFRIWPNRGQPIESTFVKELTAALQVLDAEYRDWMIAVYYEVEKKPSNSRNWK